MLFIFSSKYRIIFLRFYHGLLNLSHKYYNAALLYVSIGSERLPLSFTTKISSPSANFYCVNGNSLHKLTSLIQSPKKKWSSNGLTFPLYFLKIVSLIPRNKSSESSHYLWGSYKLDKYPWYNLIYSLPSFAVISV